MTRLSFVKMHGLGNDYVLFDTSENELGGLDPGALARKVCERRFSIGADGIIVLWPKGPGADFTMRVFNPDGSETGSCGTAFRCVARFAYEQRRFDKAAREGIRIATFARSAVAKVVHDASGKLLVEVTMGKALFKRGDIPVAGDADAEFLEQPMTIDGNDLIVSAVSVGNPHAAVFCDDVSKVALEELGPAVETHPVFPERANVHFVQVMSRTELTVRTWERGTGPTLSCGTGASAAAALARRLGKTEPSIRIWMPGGGLDITVDDNYEIVMRAEAIPVFSGVLDYEA